MDPPSFCSICVGPSGELDQRTKGKKSVGKFGKARCHAPVWDKIVLSKFVEVAYDRKIQAEVWTEKA